MVPTLFGITLVVFAAMHAMPGDPVDALSASDAGTMEHGTSIEARAERVRADNLLDRSLLVQYAHFVGPFDLSPSGHRWFGGTGARPWHGLLVLDFGHEIQRRDVDVASEIGRRLLVTVPLALSAVILTYLLAVPLGVWAAARAGTKRERAVALGLFLLHAMPVFWLGLLFVLAFGATGLSWLPVIGLHDKDASSFSALGYALDALRHALLPVLTLTLGGLAYVSRHVRAGVLANLRADFVRTARAKGLAERDVLTRHALRNALLPLITLLGSVLPALVAGSIVVETVFGIEGVGRYVFEGVLARDANVVLATTVVSAVATMLGILVADVAYTLADPRIRHV